MSQFVWTAFSGSELAGWGCSRYQISDYQHGKGPTWDSSSHMWVSEKWIKWNEHMLFFICTRDGEQHFPAGSKGGDAQFLQVLVCQSQECLEVNLEAAISPFNTHNSATSTNRGPSTIKVMAKTRGILSTSAVLKLPATHMFHQHRSSNRWQTHFITFPLVSPHFYLLLYIHNMDI